MRFSKTLVVLTALAAIACGPLHLGSRERAAVVFTNDSGEQADVYALVGSSETVRLGTVLSARTETLYLPTSITDQGGQTRIIVRLLARNAQRATGVLTLRATDQVKVRLTSDARSLVVTPP
jgi:hypothetical protein